MPHETFSQTAKQIVYFSHKLNPDFAKVQPPIPQQLPNGTWHDGKTKYKPKVGGPDQQSSGTYVLPASRTRQP